MQRVINFSGGKTSALMTILLCPTANDIVLFTDTGREHPKTYQFINDFERYEKIKVHRTAYENKKAPGLKGFDALNFHKIFLPSRQKRICTEELKILTAKRYLRTLNIQHFENYIGFRADEMQRVNNRKQYFKKVKDCYPLVEKGITKPMVDQYWLMKPYTLEIPSILGNCDCCFLKGANAIIRILQLYPELADKWIKDEELMITKGRINLTYIQGITFKEMLKIANSQKSLFEIDIIEPAYNCSCST